MGLPGPQGSGQVANSVELELEVSLHFNCARTEDSGIAVIIVRYPKVRAYPKASSLHTVPL